MLRRLSVLSFFALALLALTSCGGGIDFEAHYSDSGLVMENYLPADVGMLVSFSLRDSEQLAAVQAVESKLGDAGRLSRTFAEQFDASFSNLGLEYERDLEPAFGENFRFVYAARMVGSDTSETVPETFGVVTLADADRLESIFQVLVDAQQVEEKTVSGASFYVNNEQDFYATIHEDLFLMANDADNLQAMLEQDKDASLWESDDYQEALEEVGSDQVLYAMMFPANYLGDLDLPSVFSMGDLPSILDYETLVVRAEPEGLRFEAYVNANKSKAKELDVSLDQVPHADPYLHAEVPADHLLAYFESYGLKQSLEAANKLGSGNESAAELETELRSYLGMGLEDLTSFLDKGYALALHTNGEGLFPGITVYVDVSSNPEKAKELLDKVDGQLSGLIAVFEASLPGAFVKDTVDIDGEILNRVKIDLSSIPRSQETPLPASITDSPIELVYGIKGDRLILSTATVWEEGGTVTVADSDLYNDLNGYLKDVDEGLILVDAQEIAGFAANLRALREQLGLQVSEGALSFEDFLSGFEGAIAKSHSNAYDSLFSGYLELAK